MPDEEEGADDDEGTQKLIYATTCISKSNLHLNNIGAI